MDNWTTWQCNRHTISAKPALTNARFGISPSLLSALPGYMPMRKRACTTHGPSR